MSPQAGGRTVGVDVARALASLIMVQGHAYHAWVAEPHRTEAPYLFTRLLGTLPLPAFLVLAGVGLGLRARAAERSVQPAAELRRSLVRRGLQIVLVGYASNVAFALVDGYAGVATWLRADVLHVIGLSLMAMALCGVRAGRGGGVRLRWLQRSALALAAVSSLACPWLSPLGNDLPTWLSPLLAPFVDVPGYTRMPLIPLVAWLALGASLGASRRLLPLSARSPFESRAGTSKRRVWLLGLGSLSIALAAHAGTAAWVSHSDMPLSRSHPAVVLNVLDYAARGSLVLALGLGLGGLLSSSAGRGLARIGQGSLWIYLAHLPFSYGRPGAALAGALDMTHATLWLVPLMAFSVGIAWLHARWLRPAPSSGATASATSVL